MPQEPNPRSAPLVDHPPIAAGQRPLAERLSAAQPRDRTAILFSAAARGERISLPGADLRGLRLRPGRHGPTATSTDATRGEARTAGQRLMLDGVDLTGATLSGACLTGVSLRGALLDGALLVGADLTGADLTGVTLSGANLTGARLRRADLSFADLRGTSLLTADLSEVTATGADLREALLQSTNLSRAMLRSADLRWSRLDGADLRGATLDSARFEGAVLSSARLAGTRLSPDTDFSFAFLHEARIERTSLERAHLGGGVGEQYTHYGSARDTYRALRSFFESTGRRSDARWAHRQAWSMETASHRPDRARRYYGRASLGRTRPGVAPRDSRLSRLPLVLPQRIEPGLFHAYHGALWLLGHLTSVFTGYGTSLRRILLTLLATWLCFAAMYGLAGSVIHYDGRPISSVDILRYSAAALTPIDAYPLVATSEAARAGAVLEGMLGIVLLGALGYMAASRAWKG